MGTSQVAPPPGFVLDSDHPPLPPGFELDGKPSGVDTTADVAKSAGIGIVKGGLSLGGMLGDLTDLGAKGIQKGTDLVTDTLGMQRVQHPMKSRQDASLLHSIPTSASLQKGLETMTGPLYEPKTKAGEVVESVASFVPGAVLAPGSMVGNAIRYGVVPGIASEAAGKALEGSEYKDWGKAAAGIAAGLVNPSRLISPLPISPGRAAMLNTLENEGVTSLTAGQRTGSVPLQYMESAASSAPGAGGRAEAIQGEGRRQFTEAAVRRAGAGPDASPEVLGPNSRRLGGEFDRLSAQNNLVPDNQFILDLTDSVRNYRRVPDSQQRAMVQGYVDDIIDHVNAGHMPGPQYQEMRSRMGNQAQSLRQTDPTLSEALRDMRNSLDNAMRRSISPADAEAWDLARQQYGAQKVLEKSASKAGAETAEGQISPANLRNTVAAENRGAYARGEGQFNELARAGVNVMSPLPNSGTAQRHNAFNLLNQATLGVVPAMTGRAVMSPPVQGYLANQLMAGALPANATARDLLIAEMLQRSQQPAQQPQ